MLHIRVWSVYWPSINSDIDNTVSSCEKCSKYLPSQQKEPILREEEPSRIFQNVSADFFQSSGRNFLVYTDRLSSWPIVYPFSRGHTTARDLIGACRKCFVDLGVPQIFRSDCGPQFSSKEFKDFLNSWGVIHRTSSPYYAQSNGHAEASVKAMKSLIAKTTQNGNINTEEFQKGLLEWRNTPNQSGRSPAEIVYGHPLRTLIPIHRSSFQRKWHDLDTEFDKRRTEEKALCSSGTDL